MARREEIEALIKLMDDPDSSIREAVLNRFNSLGEDAVPLLDEFQVSERNPEIENHLNATIHTLTIRSLEQEFLNYLENGVHTLEDLETGMMLLARFGNPTLRTSLYSRKLDTMADSIREQVELSFDPLEQMFVVLTYLFKMEQFKGNEVEYFEPSNTFINQVLDKKRGLPISLALIVLFLARRLDLPFQGVNMPLHFILRFDFAGESYLIDPFRGGNIVRAEQCHLFLRQNGIEPEPFHFEPAEPIDILSRCLRNLINGYEKLGDSTRMEHMKRWYSYIELMQLNSPRY